MAEYKTPGVYIVEKDAFPNTIVAVETAVPVFIGYTEKAVNNKKSLKNKPIRITTFAEYGMYFGGGPAASYDLNVDKDDESISFAYAAPGKQYRLYNSLRLFYANGGGPCYIVSVGSYGDTIEKDKLLGGLTPLVKEQEPTLVVVPDAMSLGEASGSYDVYNAALAHCEKMQSRFAIMDVYGGFQARQGLGIDTDVVEDFRDGVVVSFKWGAAYYPWLNTSIVGDSEVNFSNLSADGRKALATLLASEKNVKVDLKEQVGMMTGFKDGSQSDPAVRSDLISAHLALKQFSPTYKTVMQELKAEMNLMPPAAAMAGIYTRTDNEVGVWQSPANTGVVSVTAPSVNIDHDEQEDLNMPLNGKAVNAIRSFPGYGVLVWGARTLDGNSQDWRYISVRRTLIMLEQSIKIAMKAYVFEPNTASTWSTVNSMITNFLTNQWKNGALAGATPGEAFQVQIGLGATMTANDILDGYMRVTVLVAIVRPAEFIELTFQQKMQTS